MGCIADNIMRADVWTKAEGPCGDGRNADAHIENGSDYDSDDGCSAVRFFPILLVPEVDKVLRGSGGWQFNAFKLKETTNDAPLSTLTFWLLQTTGLIREFGGSYLHSCVNMIRTLC